MTDGYKIKRILVWQGGTEKQIYPAGWKPNANTLLYLPLKEDLLDHSQYNRTITQTGTITKDSTGYKFYQSYLTSSNFSGPSICTLSVWAYMVGTGGIHAVIAEKYYGPNSPYITTNLACFNGTYEPTMEYANSSQTVYQALSGTSIQGGWHHIVGTYDGTNGTIYVDNVLKATVSVSGNLLSTDTAFVVGTFLGNPSGQWFNGYISDVIFEDKVWTADEITAYYNQTKSTYGL